MEKTLRILLALAISITLTVAAGCGTTPTAHSGFLGNYSQLQPDPEDKDRLIYRASGSKVKQYNKFIVDRVVVHFAPNAKGTTINTANVNTLSNHLHNEVVKALSASGRYRVVNSPGREVLRVRIAITDIEKSNVGMNALPQTKLMGVGLGGASFEGEIVDSVSGDRIAATVDSQKGSRASMAGLTTFGDAEAVMTKWAERLVKKLDDAHGYK